MERMFLKNCELGVLYLFVMSDYLHIIYDCYQLKMNPLFKLNKPTKTTLQNKNCGLYFGYVWSRASTTKYTGIEYVFDVFYWMIIHYEYNFK